MFYNKIDHKHAIVPTFVLKFPISRAPQTSPSGEKKRFCHFRNHFKAFKTVSTVHPKNHFSEVLSKSIQHFRRKYCLNKVAHMQYYTRKTHSKIPVHKENMAV